LEPRQSDRRGSKRTKVFWFFFEKKNDFLPVNIRRQAATYSKVYSPTIGKIPM
jgi:hypothetical protein